MQGVWLVLRSRWAGFYRRGGWGCPPWGVEFARDRLEGVPERGLAQLPALGFGHGASQPRAWLLGRWTSRYGGTLLLGVGALSILAEADDGLHWIVAGVVLAVIGGVANAWVLLVEILR